MQPVLVAETDLYPIAVVGNLVRIHRRAARNWEARRSGPRLALHSIRRSTATTARRRDIPTQESRIFSVPRVVDIGTADQACASCDKSRVPGR